MRIQQHGIPAQVPVFPLPGVVLFPRALLPLKIFEPRYRAMVSDVLDSHGCIAMALFKPGWETEYFESPQVFRMVGVGRVVQYHSLTDGNYKIILWGERRAEIQEWIPGRPYRVARVLQIPEEPPAPHEWEGLRTRIRRYFHSLIRRDRKLDARVKAKIDEAVVSVDDLGFLVDSIAYHFLEDPEEKQVLLEVRNAAERARLLGDFLVRHGLIGQDEGSIRSGGEDRPDTEPGTKRNKP